MEKALIKKMNFIQKLKHLGIGGYIADKYLTIFFNEITKNAEKTEAKTIVEAKNKNPKIKIFLIDKKYSNFCKYFWKHAPLKEKLCIIESLLWYTILKDKIFDWEYFLFEGVDSEEEWDRLIRQDRDEIMAENILKN